MTTTTMIPGAEYRDGRLVVDEAQFSPSGVYFRIGAQAYRMEPAGARPVSRLPDVGTPFQGYAYKMEGLYPREGYGQFCRRLGRAITAAELAELRAEYGLGGDDVSAPFDAVHRGCFGAPPEYHVPYMAIQIAVSAGEAIRLEARLRGMGIEAGNGSPGRVTIRI